MSLAASSRLGPYEIVSPLGAGGMGEVYRARDTRLGRDVAIKVIPEELAADAERLRRFEQEARATAALNHPNILALFDVGVEGEVRYIVEELLKGETLGERLHRQRLKVSEAVGCAVQIARGLAAAHAQGIVHRDLKPENVFLTRDGSVKLLDFGLAKLRESKPVSVDTETPTATAPTEVGTRLGTVGYMSPEQARGESVDARSDIFSLGVVLYEMLAGHRAFAQASPLETQHAILKEEPPELPGVGATIPVVVDRVMRRCLEKGRGARFQSAHDVALALEAASAPSGSVVASPAKRWRPWQTWVLRGALLAAVAVLVGAGFELYRGGQKAGLQAAAEISFRQMSFRPQAIFRAAFAPDGEAIVYSAALEGNVPELFMIRPEYPEPRPLGLPRTHLLSVSSKGELAVLTNARYLAQRLFTGTLARIPLGGTAPREILENVRQADWSPDGAELAIIHSAEGKDRLEFPIGTILYEATGYLSDLRVSPRGDRVALFEHPMQFDDRGTVIVVDRAGRRTVLSGDFHGEEGLSWSKSGDEILFTASAVGWVRTLYGVDLSGRLRVALRSAGGLTMHDVSRAGRWLVTRDDSSSRISVLVPGASAERDLSWLDGSTDPFLSQDGSQMLFNDESTNAGLNYQVCFRRTDGGAVVRLGEGRGWGLSADGKWALTTIHTPPQLVIYPIGPGETKRLPRGNLEVYHWASWLPDGKSVLVAANEAGKPARCYVQDIAGGLPRPVTPDAIKGSVSPDGLQILYAGLDGTWLVQRAEGRPAEIVAGLTAEDRVIRWSTDGRSLYVYSGATMPLRFERLDLTSGRRVLVREVAPADRTGVLMSTAADLIDNAKSYAYEYYRMTSHLFLVEGAQ